MPEHFTDGADPMAAFDLDITRTAEREQRELEAAGNKPNHDGGVEWFLAISPRERLARYKAGEPSLRQLAAWSACYPDEVPKLPYLGGMEFEWIVRNTPEWCEAAEHPARQRERAAAAPTTRAVRPARRTGHDPDKWAEIQARWRQQAANSSWE